MANPPPYHPDFSFAGYQSATPAQPLPGTRVDVEYINIEAALNGTQEALSDIRREDGGLQNGIVDVDNMSPELIAAFAEADADAADAAAAAAAAAASAASAAAAAAAAAALLASFDGEGDGSPYGVITPQMFGAVGDGTADDTAELHACFDSALISKFMVYIPVGGYKVSRLTIPAGLVIRASRNAVIRSDGSTTGSQLVLDIGNNVDFDTLVVGIPGTEAPNAVIRIGDNVRGGLLRLTSDVLLVTPGGHPTGVRGITTRGQDVRIGRLEIVNVDTGIDFYNNASTTPTTGTDIGFIDITNYLRGVFLVNCSARIGGLRVVKRAASAVTQGPGQNALLIAGCQNLEIGDCWIEESSEHAIRIGGSPLIGTKTANVRIGNVTTVRSRGCSIKINPTLLVAPGVTETADNIQIGNVLAIDGADGEPQGNREMLRLSHCRNVQIGDAMSSVQLRSASHQYGLSVNDVRNVQIASVGGVFYAGFVNFSSTQDVDEVSWFAGDVIGLRVGRLHGASPGIGNAIAVSMSTATPALNVADVHLHCDGLSGFATNLLFWVAGNLTGQFRITGWVGGSVQPAYASVPNDNNFQLDVTWNNQRSIGHAYGSRGTAVMEITPPAFSVESTAPNGLLINNVRATAGSGLYGGAIAWTRLAGQRRAAAIVPRQGSADDKEVGLDFYVGDVNTVANESLLLAMRLNYQTRVEFPTVLVKYADNAAAIAGGLTAGTLYWTATGEARIVV